MRKDKKNKSTNIRVTEETRKKLNEIRDKYNLRSVDVVINKLLEKNHDYETQNF